MRELQGPDVRQATPTPAPEPRVAGGVVVYRLYDVGYEIDLERAMSLLAAGPGEPAALRLALPHADHLRPGWRHAHAGRAPPSRPGLGTGLRLRGRLPAPAPRGLGHAVLGRVLALRERRRRVRRRGGSVVRASRSRVHGPAPRSHPAPAARVAHGGLHRLPDYATAGPRGRAAPHHGAARPRRGPPALERAARALRRGAARVASIPVHLLSRRPGDAHLEQRTRRGSDGGRQRRPADPGVRERPAARAALLRRRARRRAAADVRPNRREPR